MTDAYTGYATENVVEPTPEELEALREMMPPTRPLVGRLGSAIGWVYRPDGDAVTETGAGDAEADGRAQVVSA